MQIIYVLCQMFSLINFFLSRGNDRYIILRSRYAHYVRNGHRGWSIGRNVVILQQL